MLKSNAHTIVRYALMTLAMSILHNGALNAALSYEKLMNDLASLGLKTFGYTSQDQLVINDFNPQMLEQWDPIVKEASAFVKSNASSDKKLIAAMDVLEKSNTTVYRSVLRLNQSIKASATLSPKEYVDEAKKGREVLLPVEKTIKAAMGTLDKSYILPGRKKCLEVLKTLSAILIEAINGAETELSNWNDWRKQPQNAGNPNAAAPVVNNVSLDDVVQGKLGDEFTQKANALLNSDYTKAKKEGFFNLADRLKKEFAGGPLQKDAAKKAIDSLFKTFTNYKTKQLVQ